MNWAKITAALKQFIEAFTFVVSNKNDSLPITPPPMPSQPAPAPQPLSFATPKQAWHAVRVMCDNAGLSFTQKNILCACVFQESEFNNKAIGKNANSTDWGIIQVNDKYNIGVGKMFPSVQYVLNNPDRCVAWMIHTMKVTGKLEPWASFTSGAFHQWLPLTSKMWLLAEK